MKNEKTKKVAKTKATLVAELEVIAKCDKGFLDSLERANASTIKKLTALMSWYSTRRKSGFFIFKKVLTNTAKRATIPGWRAGRRRDAQRLVDILWITRHVSRRHHFYTSLLHFGADAIDLTLHFCTLAQGAPTYKKLNENHSHLEIVTQLSHKRYWQIAFTPLNLHSKFKGESTLFKKKNPRQKKIPQGVERDF